MISCPCTYEYVHVGSASGVGDDPRDYLRLTSSRAVVMEGGSVEFVCEASLSLVEVGVEGEGKGAGSHGQCVPYNVTWSVSSSGSDGALRPVDGDTSSSSQVLLNNHLLRVGGVSSGSSQYCCQVHTTAATTGQTISQECTTIHAVPRHGM